MVTSRIRAVIVAACLTLAPNAGYAESASLILNWTPTADHAPYYYAKQLGWYEKAGIDLTIETGRGSGVSAQRVGSGGSAFGIADLATALVARGKGADVVAVMSVYANTGQGFYWLKSSGIKGPKDFPGRKLGNPPGDAARVMWPAFTKQVGIDPGSVTFVNIAPPAKMPALKSKAVDIITDFFNEHDLKLREFGDDLGYVGWRDVGLNPYGNSIIVNGGVLKQNPELVKTFVQISQKAFAACVADVKPCIAALMAGSSGLDEGTQLNQWERIKWMMADDFTTAKALGWIDPDRLKKDYELVSTYVGLDKPFDLSDAFTTRFLDASVKMDGSKVKR